MVRETQLWQEQTIVQIFLFELHQKDIWIVNALHAECCDYSQDNMIWNIVWYDSVEVWWVQRRLIEWVFVKAHIKRPRFHVSLWKYIFLEAKYLNLNTQTGMEAIMTGLAFWAHAASSRERNYSIAMGVHTLNNILVTMAPAPIIDKWLFYTHLLYRIKDQK